MPFVEATTGDSRKRGWEDDDWPIENTHCLYSPPSSENGHSNFYLLDRQDSRHMRKIQPLMKRARTTPNDAFHTTNSTTADIRQSSLPPGSLRDDTSFNFRPTPPARTTSTLTPCHICHRKPTKKSHLDSFAQCQGCGEQTCFVCIRECMGWNVDDGSMLCEQELLSRSFHMDDADNAHFEHSSVQGHNNSQDGHDDGDLRRRGWDAAGHRGVVCSRCCIERGAEGDIVCLGCLPRLEGA